MLSAVTVPTEPAASPASESVPNHTTVSLTAGETYTTVTVNAGATLTLNPGAAYVMSSLTLTGNSFISVPVGPVIVYLTGAGTCLDLSGGSVTNSIFDFISTGPRGSAWPRMHGR